MKQIIFIVTLCLIVSNCGVKRPLIYPDDVTNKTDNN